MSATEAEESFPNIEDKGDGLVRVNYGPKHFCITDRKRAEELLGLKPGESQVEVITRDPNKHDQERWQKFYLPIFEGNARQGAGNVTVPDKDFVCNEELAHPVAEKEWPHYYMGEGRKGPRPFRSMSERREYLKRYGFGEG